MEPPPGKSDIEQVDVRLMRALPIGIMIAAIAVRALALYHRSWWIDELITRNTARLPLWKSGVLHPENRFIHSILGFCLQDTGPGPLSYTLDGALAQFAEPLGGEFWLRIPGILAGVTLVALVLYAPAQRWRAGALAAGAFAALFPPFVDWSTGARGYAWGVLIAGAQFAVSLSDDDGVPRAMRSARVWILWLVLALIGMLVNPLHTVWNIALVFGAALAWITRREFRRVSAKIFFSALAVAIALNAAYVALWWKMAFGSESHPRATAGLEEIGARFAALFSTVLSNPENLLMAILLVATCALAVVLRRRERTLANALLSAAIVYIALSVVLLSRQFLELRYLYPLTIPLVYLLGAIVQTGYERAERRVGSARAAPLLALFCVIVLAAQAGPAARRALTPMHNWRDTVLRLKALVRPNDVVFCGPNADFEVLLAYGRAADLPAVVPRYVRAADGRMVDAFTTQGVRSVLDQHARAWFVSPFWGVVRPPDYWRTIQSEFRDVFAVPGRAPIRVMLHDPNRL